MNTNSQSTKTKTQAEHEALLSELLSNYPHKDVKQKINNSLNPGDHVGKTSNFEQLLPSFLRHPSPWRLIFSIVALLSLSLLGFSFFISGLQSVITFVVLLYPPVLKYLRRDYREMSFIPGIFLCAILIVANGTLFYYNFALLQDLLFGAPNPILSRDRFLFSAITAVDTIMVTLSFEAVKPILLKIVGETKDSVTPQPFYTWIIFIISVVGVVSFGALAAASPGS